MAGNISADSYGACVQEHPGKFYVQNWPLKPVLIYTEQKKKVHTYFIQ